MNRLREKLKINSYSNEKLRFLLFSFSLFLVLFLARYLLGMAYARYEVRSKIMANIDRAVYIFTDEKMSFNLEPNGIVPSDDPYVYRFTVSNFMNNKDGDVDLSYLVKIKTTTNLPIIVRLYRNELYNTPGATNILGGATTAQDEDGAWYRVYQSAGSYNMNYNTHTTDVYSLVIDFSSSYKNTPSYANKIEHIQVILESQQVI